MTGEQTAPMDDIGFYLVIAYLFLVPWLVRLLPPRESLRWIAFAIGGALLVLQGLGQIHLWLDNQVAGLPPRARLVPPGQSLPPLTQNSSPLMGEAGRG